MAESNKSRAGSPACSPWRSPTSAGPSFLAAEFFQNDPTAGGGRETNFWVNSFEQLPHCASVFGYAYRERFWMLMAIPILEIGVLGFWRILKSIEKGLA